MALFRQEKWRNRWLAIAGSAVAVVILLIIILLLIGSGGKADMLKGKWSIDSITAYEFDGEGNGALVLPGSRYEFSYKITEDQLKLDFVDDAAADGTYTFTVMGDKVLLEGGEGTIGGSYELFKME